MATTWSGLAASSRAMTHHRGGRPEAKEARTPVVCEQDRFRPRPALDRAAMLGRKAESRRSADGGPTARRRPGPEPMQRIPAGPHRTPASHVRFGRWAIEQRPRRPPAPLLSISGVDPRMGFEGAAAPGIWGHPGVAGFRGLAGLRVVPPPVASAETSAPLRSRRDCRRRRPATFAAVGGLRRTLRGLPDGGISRRRPSRPPIASADVYRQPS